MRSQITFNAQLNQIPTKTIEICENMSLIVSKGKYMLYDKEERAAAEIVKNLRG